MFTLCDIMSFMSLLTAEEALTDLGLLNNHSKDSLVTMSPMPTKDMVDKIGQAEVTNATAMYSSTVGT